MGCSNYKFQFESEEDESTDSLRIAVSGQIFYYHPDHLGTNTIISNSYGTIHQYFFNLPFGETMVEGTTNSSYPLDYKFNGKEFDAESGLYYYGSRYYDPRISVWLSVDPLVEKYPNLNPYCFSGNNTFNIIDPNGQYLFGLFGSTKEQRAAARQFADKHNGEINKIYSKDISVGYQTGGNGPEVEVIWQTKHFYREGSRTNRKGSQNGNGSDGGYRGGAPLTTSKGGDRQGPAISTKGETGQPINIDYISAALTSPPNERAGNILDLARIINDWTNLASILGYGEEKEKRSCSGDIDWVQTDTIETNYGGTIRKTYGSIRYGSVEDSIDAVEYAKKMKNWTIIDYE